MLAARMGFTVTPQVYPGMLVQDALEPGGGDYPLG
jgi:hypothetical protein